MASDLTRDEEHVYRWRGKVVPGVTEILRPLRQLWSSGEDLEVARQRGIARHAMLHFEATGQDYDCPEWLLPARKAWRKFVSDTGLIVVASEQMLYSEIFGYAGQLDLDVMLTNTKHPGPAIIDLKSTLGGKTDPLQTAGYERLVNGPRRRFGLRLTPTVKFIEYEDPGDWGDFLTALNWYRLYAKHKRRSK